MSEQPKRSALFENEKPAADRQGSAFMQAMQDSSFMESMKDAQPEGSRYDELLEQLDTEEQQEMSSSAVKTASGNGSGDKKLSRREKAEKAKNGSEKRSFEPIEYEDASEVSQRLKKARKRREHQLLVIGPVLFICVVLNIIAWNNSSFSLWYMQEVFPKISTLYARLTNRIPFSFGELLIQIGLWTVAVSTPLFILLMIIKRKDRDFKRTVRRIYQYFYAWVLTFVLLTETLNCFILYHTPTFVKMYDYPGKWYTPSQLEQLCDYLIAETNAAAAEVKRDKDGRFILTADLDDTAKASMRKLAKEYPELGGWYTSPKPIKHSFFMSQQYLLGIYFPFTMEANYNDEIPKLNLPDTVCHELAHTKGFMREDEANFIGFLACDASESPDYRYSGYLRAMKYVIAQCEENCSEETVARLYDSISDEVLTDWNVNIEHWQKVQKSDEGLFDSEKVAEVSDKVSDASMKLNGVEDGKKSYDRVTDLLLDWYFMQQEEETKGSETHETHVVEDKDLTEVK